MNRSRRNPGWLAVLAFGGLLAWALIYWRPGQFVGRTGLWVWVIAFLGGLVASFHPTPAAVLPLLLVSVYAVTPQRPASETNPVAVSRTLGTSVLAFLAGFQTAFVLAISGVGLTAISLLNRGAWYGGWVLMALGADRLLGRWLLRRCPGAWAAGLGLFWGAMLFHDLDAAFDRVFFQARMIGPASHALPTVVAYALGFSVFLWAGHRLLEEGMQICGAPRSPEKARQIMSGVALLSRGRGTPERTASRRCPCIMTRSRYSSGWTWWPT